MNGLELSREYYELCKPVLQAKIPEIMAQAACGLVGEGSECFGLDDEFSRDHDFGAAFCIWLPRETLFNNYQQIEDALALLPASHAGFPGRMAPDARAGRVGPLPLEDFYAALTGLDHPPADWREWLNLPEKKAAVATNGEVFEDNYGAFSQWRKVLLDFYPRDVLLKKLAARVMNMAQAGQYNLARTLKRGDGPAAMLTCSSFAEAALSFVFLLNRQYMPYYKLAPKLCRQLPVLGNELSELLEELAAHPLRDKRDMGCAVMVEDFCSACAAHLRAIGLSKETDSWLWAHGPQIIAHIQNPDIQRLNLLEA